MNDLDLCLQLVSRSRQPLRYIWRWISRKPLEIEAWFQRTTNWKWHMGYRMVTWPMTSRSRDPRRCCEAVQSAILATAWLLVRSLSCCCCNEWRQPRWDSGTENGRSSAIYRLPRHLLTYTAETVDDGGTWPLRLYTVVLHERKQ